MHIAIHVDGGARGNPGPAGAGVVIADAQSHELLHKAGYWLGRATNNVAEYHGLLRALQIACALKPDSTTICSDSQLMVRQILGQYRVKAAQLKPLFEQVMQQLDTLGDWRIDHVKRELNKEADQMANQAMDAREDVIAVDALLDRPRSADAPPTPAPRADSASVNASDNTADADASQRQAGLDAVRQRPNIYIGMPDVEGLHELAAEVIRAAAGLEAGNKAANVDVSLTADGALVVDDDGRGLPVDARPFCGVPQPAIQMVMMSLPASTPEPADYAAAGYLLTIGPVLNALSDRLQLTTAHDGRTYTLALAQGRIVELLCATSQHRQRGARIEFHPDPHIFGSARFEADRLRDITQQISRETKGVRITFNH